MKLVPFFQPIIDIVGNNVIGYEALIRGKSNNEIIGAEDIFECANQFGGVIELDTLTRELAIREGSELISNDQKLFLNIAEPTFSHDLDWFPEDLPLGQFVLEINENVNAALIEADVKQQLEKYREQGLVIAIDDFGVKRANLQMMTELNPDWIKLDQSFVQSGRFDIIRSMKQFCESGGYGFVVEGIETEEMHNRVIDCGVQFAQGYWYGKLNEAKHYKDAAAY